MKSSLKGKLSNYCDYSEGATQLFIIDWTSEIKDYKPQNVGGCCSYIELPNQEFNNFAVKLSFEEAQPIEFTGLKNSAWRKNSIGQCDAIIWKQEKEPFLILVEIKNSNSRSDETWEVYKDKPIKQILDTLSQLKELDAPLPRKFVGLISFPRINKFSASIIPHQKLRDIAINKGVGIEVGDHLHFDKKGVFAVRAK